MPRFAQEQLVDKALMALREAMTDCYHSGRGVAPTRALRFALAFLYTGGDRQPFDDFWRDVTQLHGADQAEVMSTAFGRYQTLRSNLNRIARLHGVDYY
jgi:muramidase (phage lysozyme)